MAVARRLSQSTPSPTDGAPLLRKALVQLFAVVLLLDGQEPTTAEASRSQVLSSERHRELFADVVDDLPWLDELSRSFEVDEDPTGAATRFRRLSQRLAEVHRKVGARFDARLKTDGARPMPRGALGGVGLVVLAGLLAWGGHRWAAGGPAGNGEEQPVGQPPAQRDGPDLAGRCFEATFFSDPDFKTPIHTRRDCQIVFDWGEGAVPGVPSCPVDSFSIRWEGLLEPPRSDRYRFHLTSDDGSRLYLNDQLVVDNWGAHGPVEVTSAPMELTAGAEISIVVEYNEFGGAAEIDLSWSSPSLKRQPVAGAHVRPNRGSPPRSQDGGASPTGRNEFGPSQCFLGRYFLGRDWQQQVHQRRDCRLAFDWGVGAVAGIDDLPVDDFSVRWEGTLLVPTTDDHYVFYLGSDDGSRLLLDGAVLVDHWTEHGFGYLQSPPTKLIAGVPYPIVVEFFETRELATLRLEWSSSTLARQVLTGHHVTAPKGTEGGVDGQHPSAP